jgi:hypothetical protein
MTKTNLFYAILAFYAVLSYLIFPFIFYQYKKSLESAGTGFVVGSVISIILWITYGSKLIKS